jgi:FKBP12-rapamycin complex-associated protein
VDFPALLNILLRLLNEKEMTRREVLKTLGIIGALDPHTHKVNQLKLQGEADLSSDGVSAHCPNTIMMTGVVL